jgi:Tat protein secretion system quality control protein TatD with DNase activity
MEFVDTHCNVPNVLQALSVSEPDLNWETLTSLFPATKPSTKLRAILSVSSDRASNDATLKLLDQCENVYGAFGIHPLYAYEVSFRLSFFVPLLSQLG